MASKPKPAPRQPDSTTGAHDCVVTRDTPLLIPSTRPQSKATVISRTSTGLEVKTDFAAFTANYAAHVAEFQAELLEVSARAAKSGKISDYALRGIAAKVRVVNMLSERLRVLVKPNGRAKS